MRKKILKNVCKRLFQLWWKILSITNRHCSYHLSYVIFRADIFVNSFFLLTIWW